VKGEGRAIRTRIPAGSAGQVISRHRSIWRDAACLQLPHQQPVLRHGQRPRGGTQLAECRVACACCALHDAVERRPRHLAICEGIVALRPRDARDLLVAHLVPRVGAEEEVGVRLALGGGMLLQRHEAAPQAGRQQQQRAASYSLRGRPQAAGSSSKQGCTWKKEERENSRFHLCRRDSTTSARKDVDRDSG
jgi:hypothetical protein